MWINESSYTPNSSSNSSSLPQDAHIKRRIELQPRLAAFHLQQHNVYLFAGGQFENVRVLLRSHRYTG